MPEDDSRVSRATAELRVRASRARRLASALTDEHDQRALLRLADELEAKAAADEAGAVRDPLS